METSYKFYPSPSLKRDVVAAAFVTALTVMFAFTGCRAEPEVLFEEEEENPIPGFNTPNANFDRAVIKNYLALKNDINDSNEATVTLELSGSLRLLAADSFNVTVKPEDVKASKVNKTGSAYTLKLSSEGETGALLELLKNGVEITLKLVVPGTLTGGPNQVAFAAPWFSAAKGGGGG